MTQNSEAAFLLPLLGMERNSSDQTYLDHVNGEVWIGDKWDLAIGLDGDVDVYRKGSFVIRVRSLMLAAAIIDDDRSLDDHPHVVTIQPIPHLEGRYAEATREQRRRNRALRRAQIGYGADQ